VKGRLLRFLAINTAKKNKINFLNDFNCNWLNNTTQTADFNVLSFSGSNQFADQLYSISSFYRNIGIPKSWIVYNDGSYSPDQLRVLHSIVNVKVKDVLLEKDSFHKSWINQYPTLLKVEILRNITDYSRTILFTDSDVLFYPLFKKYTQTLFSDNWYIVDESEGYFDSSFKLLPKEKPLNFGFLVLNAPSNWNFVYSYINEHIKSGTLGYWTDQTAMHLLSVKEKFHFLPVGKFVVGGKDSFKLSHDFNYSKIALRHFVGPIRHKMWQYSWKKVLGFKK
jgi:hypothetical protein